MKTPKKYLRKDPAIILLEALISQADLRTKAIMSWIDFTDLDQNEEKSDLIEILISTSKLTELTGKETLPTAFEK